MIVDHSRMKLGKLPPRIDARTFKLEDYANFSKLPTPPDSCTWSKKVLSWPMMLNNLIGDCGIAAQGHAIQGWTANAGKEITPLDADILSAYEAISGYVPRDPATDKGIVLLDGLNYWRQTGLAGRKIEAYAAINPQNTYIARVAIDIFGGLYTGLELPIDAQTQDVWHINELDEPNAQPGSWGGHCVWVIDYNFTGPICVTWGQLKQMTWNFWRRYVDEAYAVFSRNFLNASTKLTPGGFDEARLLAAVQAVAA